jgi:hypothetical protein
VRCGLSGNTVTIGSTTQKISQFSRAEAYQSQ